MANHYFTSYGERVTQSQIDSRIREAKAQALENQLDAFGYNFCVDCGSNGSGTRLDCSHDISVAKAKNNRQTELCWDVANIKVRCRKCHSKHDKLCLV